MKLPKWLRRLLIGFSVLGAIMIALAGLIWWYVTPDVQITEGVVYTQRNGDDLTFNVLQPSRANETGIILVVSGSWKSSKDPIPTILMVPLLRRGYTVFTLRHQSQPESSVMEIFEDIERGIRTIRYKAEDYGIDPARIGITGGSAGGHLSLLAATRGGPGDETAEDPVDRTSSAIQAVACFFPVTDLLNLGKSTENPGDGGPPKSYVNAFGASSTNRLIWKQVGRELSPIYHITTNLPPIMISHGDADTLVPLEQSEWFVDRAREKGKEVTLLVRPDKGHGWLTMIWDIRRFALWFDRHLEPGR